MQPMRRAALVAIVTACLIVSTRGQEPVFRGGVRTVSVYATVHDKDGRLVTGLAKSDFQVLDNGKPAPITTFSNDTLPATVALMLDMSASMAGEHMRVRNAALQFVDELLPADRVRIGSFGDEIGLSPWLTSDKAVLGRVLREEIWPGGGTPLWSAMRAAMQSLADEEGHRVILTLSDGVDTGCPRLFGGGAFTPAAGPAPGVVSAIAQRTGFQSALAPLEERCATFADVESQAASGEFMTYAIGMEGPGTAGGLERLADQTGGGHFELKRNADLAATFALVLNELHHQYAMGFTPVVLDGKTHTLEVRLARPGLVARARKSYLAADK